MLGVEVDQSLVKYAAEWKVLDFHKSMICFYDSQSGRNWDSRTIIFYFVPSLYNHNIETQKPVKDQF
jgi:hypothetical protein